MILRFIKKNSILLSCFFAILQTAQGQTHIAFALEESVFFEIGQPGKFTPSLTTGGSAEISFRGRAFYISYSNPRLNRTFDTSEYEFQAPIIHFGVGRNYWMRKESMHLGYMLYFGKSYPGELFKTIQGNKKGVHLNYYTFGLGLNYQYYYNSNIAVGGNTRFEFNSWDLHEGSFNYPHPGLYRMFSIRAFVKYALPFKLNGKS